MPVINPKKKLLISDDPFAHSTNQKLNERIIKHFKKELKTNMKNLQKGLDDL